MAEIIAAIGIAASVAQLADYGFKLSIKLFSFSQAVSSADSSVKGISNDVSLTSAVLQELCGTLKADSGSHMISPAAVEATQQTVKECLSIFEELSAALDKSLANLGVQENKEKGKLKRGRVTLEKLKWPFKQPKMELLRSNLDRLKASLTLMLQVLSYARAISSRKEMESSFDYQKHLIENLARSERATARKYQALRMAIEGKSEEAFEITISTSVDPSRSRGLDENDINTSELPGSSSMTPNSLAGELLLSFRLLNDVLGTQLPVTEQNLMSKADYHILRASLVKFHEAEVGRLEEIHGSASIDLKAEAFKNVHARLKELAQVGFLQPRHPRKTLPAYDETDVPVPPQVAVQYNPVHQADFSAPADIQAYDPYVPNPSTENKRASEIQAQIDDTIGVMRENINKVAERGERLDLLADKTDNLSISAQGFRRGARRVQKRGPLTTAYQAIAYLGNESYKAIQGISDTVYEAGSALFSKGENGETGWSSNQENGPAHVGVRPVVDVVGEDEEEEELSDSLVEDLLSEWTTLPARMAEDSPTE